MGYIGDYPLTHKIAKDFLMNYSIDVERVGAMTNVEISRYEVVIVDAGVGALILEGLSTACWKTHFFLVNRAISTSNDNMTIIDVEEGLEGIVNELSEKYLLFPRYQIKETGQYYEYLKLFYAYYHMYFNKFEAYLSKQEDEELVSELNKFANEARLLGLVNLEKYADDFLEKVTWQNIDQMKEDFDMAMSALNKLMDALKLSSQVKSHKFEAVDDELRQILSLLEGCVKALKNRRPIRTRELIQTLLHYQSMSMFEENLVEASLLTQKYHFEGALEAVESIIHMIPCDELV